MVPLDGHQDDLLNFNHDGDVARGAMQIVRQLADRIRNSWPRRSGGKELISMPRLSYSEGSGDITHC
jgi:hypothetical protein